MNLKKKYNLGIYIIFISNSTALLQQPHSLKLVTMRTALQLKTSKKITQYLFLYIFMSKAVLIIFSNKVDNFSCSYDHLRLVMVNSKTSELSFLSFVFLLRPLLLSAVFYCSLIKKQQKKIKAIIEINNQYSSIQYFLYLA